MCEDIGDERVFNWEQEKKNDVDFEGDMTVYEVP